MYGAVKVPYRISLFAFVFSFCCRVFSSLLSMSV